MSRDYQSKLFFCDNCKIYYNAEKVNKESILNFYKSDYSLAKDDELLSTERRRFYRISEQIKLISILQKYVKPDTNIVDIGCDKGYFIDEARRYGFHVTGIELSELAKSYTNAISIDVKESLKELDLKYDAATMWHSLEHFENPKEFLNELKSYLNPESYLFIRVPDFGSTFSRLLKSKWKWYQPHNHLFHFTKSSIKNLLEISGFKIVKIFSKRPSNIYTFLSYRLFHSVFRKYFGNKPRFISRLKSLYESITCKELFVIARLEK